ncbi:Acetoacetyl-CoA synthetase, partial [Stegodyphus mimosarum]
MNTRNFNNVEILWKLTEESAQKTKTFMKLIESKYNTKLEDYWDLHKWSIDHISEFWSEFWHVCGIICSKIFDQVIDKNVPMEDSPSWFEGARLNFAENLLKYRDDHIALISASEDGNIEKITYAEMYEEARLYAAALRKFGLKKGDIVACYMSNRKEAVIAMLSVTSIGAIFTGALPQLGPQAVISRFQIVKPKLLFSVDRYRNNNEEIEMLMKLEEIADALPSLKKIVIVPSKEESKFKDISKIKNSCFLHDFLSTAREADGSVTPMVFEQVSFSHPVFINYTSGTTGLPKALVVGAASLLSVTRDFGSYGNEVRERV